MTPAEFAQRRRIEALDAVAAWLRLTHPDAAIADAVGMAECKFVDGSAGWRLILGDFGEAILALGPSFPYSVPRIAVLDEKLASDPHVETGGRLCLAGDAAQVDPYDPVGQVRDTIADALRLLAANSRGENAEDFAEDFAAYWRRSSSGKGVTTLVEDLGPARIGSVWLGKQFDVIAESDSAASRWMDHRFGNSKKWAFVKGVIAPVDPLPVPAEYPQTVVDLRNKLPEARALIDELLAGDQEQVIVLLQGRSPGGRVAQGIVRLTPARHHGYGTRPRNRGFRKTAALPPDIQASRWRAQRAIAVDALGARTRLPAGESLAAKHVAVIGCGSLGAGIARLLLQSGVGNLTLIDDDVMQFDNIGRHELGAAEVGQFKAQALARRLLASFPQVSSVSWHNKRWETVAQSLGENPFEQFDVVLSATGSWNSEVALNDLYRSVGAASPLVISWLERNCAAAQALLLNSTGACLRCGFDGTGTLEVPLLGWDAAQVPDGCAGPVSPYGAIELAQAQAAVAQLVVDVLRESATAPLRRLWYARTEAVQAMGGRWHTKWSRAFGDPGSGGKLVTTAWPARPECPCQS